MNKRLIRKMQTAAGGNLFSDKKDHNSRIITTGGAGYIPSTIDVSKTKQSTNKRLYRTISPLEANYSLLPALQNFLSNKEYDDTRDGINEEYPVGSVDAIWAKYLQVPEKDRRYNDRLEKSSYRPSKESNSDNYYKLPLQDYEKESLVNTARKLPLYKNKVSKLLNNYALGEHTVGRGYDNHGEYASYFDVFDINPFNGKYGGINIPIVNKLDNIGIGKPVRIYDRIYLDDYYGVKEPTHATYLPEIIITGKKKQGGKMNILEFLKNGSGIHIKKKNRGKFTSYCGGKVTDECIRKAKASGNPTLVKRATFAANARKWKHKKGGKAFVNGVSVLDSNPNAYKLVKKKVKMRLYGGLLSLYYDPNNPNSMRGVPEQVMIGKYYDEQQRLLKEKLKAQLNLIEAELKALDSQRITDYITNIGSYLINSIGNKKPKTTIDNGSPASTSGTSSLLTNIGNTGSLSSNLNPMNFFGL